MIVIVKEIANGIVTETATASHVMLSANVTVSGVKNVVNRHTELRDIRRANGNTYNNFNVEIWVW